MPKVKICDPSALGKGKSSTKPQMNTRKKKQLEDHRTLWHLSDVCRSEKSDRAPGLHLRHELDSVRGD